MDKMYEKVNEVLKMASEEKRSILERLLTVTQTANKHDNDIYDQVEAEFHVINLGQKLSYISALESIIRDLKIGMKPEKIIERAEIGMYFR